MCCARRQTAGRRLTADRPLMSDRGAKRDPSHVAEAGSGRARLSAAREMNGLQVTRRLPLPAAVLPGAVYGPR